MNLGIRAILYSARKWKKTLLVFFLLLAITTLVLSGAGDCRCTGRTGRGSPGNHRGQLYRGARHLYGRLERQLQHTGIYVRGHDPADCRSRWHCGV